MPSTVILFRTPSNDSCSTSLPDPYHHILSSHGYRPLFLPVLEQAFVDVDGLKDIIRNDPTHWSGVVGTSKRAGESWCNAFNQVIEEGTVGKGKGKQSAVLEEDSVPNWSNIPLFTPGSATMSSFSSSSFPENGPKAFPGAESTGSGSALGEFIISRHSASIDPLLILEGDKTISDLKAVLDSVDLPYHTRMIYQTSVRSDLDTDLRWLLAVLDEEQPNERIWLAFFSPSSAQPVIDLLRTMDALRIENGRSSRFDVVAIGKTTGDGLRKIGVDVGAVAKSPTAQGLLDALLEVDRKT